MTATLAGAPGCHPDHFDLAANSEQSCVVSTLTSGPQATRCERVERRLQDTPLEGLTVREAVGSFEVSVSSLRSPLTITEAATDQAKLTLPLSRFTPAKPVHLCGCARGSFLRQRQWWGAASVPVVLSLGR